MPPRHGGRQRRHRAERTWTQGRPGRHIHSTPQRAEEAEARCPVLTPAADRRAPTRGSPRELQRPRFLLCPGGLWFSVEPWCPAERALSALPLNSAAAFPHKLQPWHAGRGSGLASGGVSGLAPAVSTGLGCRSLLTPCAPLLPSSRGSFLKITGVFLSSPQALATVPTRGIFSYWTERLCAVPSTPRAPPRPARRGRYTAAGHLMTVYSLSPALQWPFSSQGRSTECARLSPH